MKKKCFILISFSVSLQLFAQNEEIIITRDDFYWEMVRTSDELYIYNDSDMYLMSKSPLSVFDGYKMIYENRDLTDVLITAEFGTMGLKEKQYRGVWLIKNKQLYLCDILFSGGKTEEVNLRGERNDQYTLMEQLTGEKFNTKYNKISLGGIEIYGLMPASWFTDTLFVKKSFRSNSIGYERWKEDGEDWFKKAYLRMVFEKGILIDMKGIVNKTVQEPFVRPARKRH